MIPIPRGTLLFGKQKDQEIVIPDFYLGKYPVTNAEYLQFVEETKSHYPRWLEPGNAYNIETGSNDYFKKLGKALTNDLHPVVGVSWDNAVAYCEWLSGKTGAAYRLPSETEWEYAARGGKESQGFVYAGSNKLKEVGWYDTNSHGETKSVGLKLANEMGLYDMSGNVWEWCADHWHENYKGIPKDGSAWIEGGDSNRRVVRGGSWFGSDSSCAVSNRGRVSTGYGYSFIGFRLARY
ncbi:MAG: formylglycine-generating enzyme family protein [Saprospiraceae bacterium]|nr:formylglycine-generating enzyme family protein [Saprospiraceae bacterium]